MEANALVNLYAVSSTVAVSLVSVIALVFLSLKPSILESILLSLVSFAVGGLLGEIIFHMLPEISKSIGMDILSGSVLLAGFMTSMIMEKGLHVHSEEHEAQLRPPEVCKMATACCGEVCSGSSCPPPPFVVAQVCVPSGTPDDRQALLIPSRKNCSHNSVSSQCSRCGYGTTNNNNNNNNKLLHAGNNDRSPLPTSYSPANSIVEFGGSMHGTTQKVRPVAWVILLGGSLHNFIDGVIIAAAYLTSLPLGFSTTIAVVCHEIPHEIGDFAVLVHSGLSKYRAFVLNFATAFFSLLGTFLFLFVGHFVKGVTPYLVPFAAGNFLYVSCCDLVPHLLKDERKLQSAVHFVCVIIGLAAMASLTYLENSLQQQE
mmetsp:Transcript_4220/g.6457  ORF Transcript_4220/g.6457 Transcript_4220/m.6457 type:complete len:372 (+) Transcript_4220:129-1244(+)|eukprot:CAMPEP_0184673908 /NCGR_PEP_ID=MMETSP0308-20130426/86941_1 /TAXON_ID=38269 /ORGANISM="Gloeochaete witrockiana, Strain SAG 46.84" /LENGTH=371 /DNA_ID=CAMNT_0027121449 /DNA_START=27 /DNA_END=1142 /DNA_ORIENTATION=+